VVHPVQGAGIVTDIGRRERRGRNKPYYMIELVSRPRTHLMVPVDSAESLGVRQAISVRRLKEVWQVLNAPAQLLPSDYRERRELLEDKLHSGDVFEVAKALRDLAWRRDRRCTGYRPDGCQASSLGEGQGWPDTALTRSPV